MFDQMPDLNKHIASVHEGKKSFNCEKCESCFDLKKDLTVHIASVHEGKKPFKCEICDDQFELKHELNEHIASVYEEENQLAHNDFEQFLKSCTARLMSQNRLSRKFLNPF